VKGFRDCVISIAYPCQERVSTDFPRLGDEASSRLLHDLGAKLIRRPALTLGLIEPAVLLFRRVGGNLGVVAE
jgi:hypothetical protein